MQNIQKTWAPVQSLLLAVSTGSVFCGMALWSLDIIPYFISWMLPQAQFHVLFVGFIAYLTSFVWLGQVKKNALLVGSIIAFCLWVLLQTLYLESYSPYPAQNSPMISASTDLLYPMLFMAWMSMLLAAMPREKIIRYMTFALGVHFFLNGLHIFGEILANMGVVSVKDFLISINGYFRKELVVDNWWPPSYYEGRIRGLHAEPAYLGVSMITVVGMSWYLYQKNKAWCWLLPIAGLLPVFLLAKNATGLLGYAVLMAAFALYFLAMRFTWKKTLLGGGVGALCVLGGLVFLLQSTFLGEKIQKSTDAAHSVAQYMVQTLQGHTLAPLVLNPEDVSLTKLFNRQAAAMGDWALAMEHPFGVGLERKQALWQVLRSSDLAGTELQNWVANGSVPSSTIYASLACELGLVGLFLFFLPVVVVFAQALRHYYKTREVFSYTMVWVLVAYLAIFLSCTLTTAFSFIYCMAFCYAATKTERSSVVCSA